MTDEQRIQFIGRILALPRGDKAALERFYGGLPEDADPNTSFILHEALPFTGVFDAGNRTATCTAFFIATYIGKTRQKNAKGSAPEELVGDYYRKCSDSGKRFVKRLFEVDRDREFYRELAHVIGLAAKDRPVDLLRLFRDVETWFGANGKSRKTTDVQRRWIDTITAEEGEKK